MQLSEAAIDNEFQISEILDSELEIKLMELGFSRGSTIKVLRKAPAKGPLTLKNQKAQIIIRNEDSKNVTVIPV